MRPVVNGVVGHDHHAVGPVQGDIQGRLAGQVVAVMRDDRHVGVVIAHIRPLRPQQFDDVQRR